MISTLYLLILIAFQLWYLTSKQVKSIQAVGYVHHITKNPQRYRILGGVLLLFAAVLFIMRLGWMSGFSAWLVGLMGLGSLVIILSPFRYLRMNTVFMLFVLSFIMELFI